LWERRASEAKGIVADAKTSVHYVDPAQPAPVLQPFTEEERRILRLVNQKVAAMPTLDDVVDFLFEETGPIFPCDRIGLAFVEDAGGRVVSQYARATYEPVLLGRGFAEDLTATSLGPVMERRMPRIIDDLVAYLEAKPASRSTRLLVREGVRSSLTCPLSVEGRVVGFMFRSSRRVHAYSSRHVELSIAIADRISQAVEKAWRIEQLEQANHAYFEMLGFVSHELKNPVASMVTDAKLLTEGYLGDLQPQQRAKIERLIDKGQYLLGLVNEYLDLARLEEPGQGLRVQHATLFIEEVLEPAVDLVRPQLETRRMHLTTELPPEGSLLVSCDPGLMRIVLVNVLGNAVKYGNPGGRIRLSVLKRKRGISVSVWNQGPGFPAAEKDKLFRRFSRLDSPALKAHKGTGVGLYNAWRIIQLHGGRIRAASKPGAWAEFSFSIPQPLPDDAAGGSPGGTP
jgi:signal transduction histidine kinase